MLKNLSYTITDKKLSYTAIVDEKKVTGSFSIKFCQSVESKLIRALCECHYYDKPTFKLIADFMNIDLSKEKKTPSISWSYYQFFKSANELASTIRKNDTEKKLEGIVYKLGDNKKTMLLASWHYLTGVRKAFFNYVLLDTKYMVSSVEREQLKIKPLPKEEISATKVTKKAKPTVDTDTLVSVETVLTNA